MLQWQLDGITPYIVFEGTSFDGRHGFWFLPAGMCYIVFNEFSLDWTHTRNLFNGFRMREQSNGLCKRRAHVACTTATPAGSCSESGSHWLYRLRRAVIQVISWVL